MTPPLPPDHPPPPSDELAPLVHKALSELLDSLGRVNVDALSAWIAAGVSLFSSGELPTTRALVAEARKVLLVQAVEQFDGNISNIARALQTSRRSAREQLKRAGLYDELTLRQSGRPSSEPLASSEEVLRGAAQSPSSPVDLPSDEEEDTHPILIDEGTDDKR